MSAPTRRLRLVADNEEYPSRPATRAECESGPRPCPWVSCKHHLLLDTAEARTGAGDDALLERLLDMKETCALDVAAAGPHKLAEIAELLGWNRQYVDRTVRRAFDRIREGHADRIQDLWEDLGQEIDSWLMP